MISDVDSLVWILAGGLLMSAIAMVGAVTLVLKPSILERMLLPLVALAAGTLLGGAFFHMLPEALAVMTSLEAASWLILGFTAFLALEQFLHWHHSHMACTDVRKPITAFVCQKPLGCGRGVYRRVLISEETAFTGTPLLNCKLLTC